MACTEPAALPVRAGHSADRRIGEKLDFHAIRIIEGDDLLTEALVRPAELSSFSGKPLRPRLEGADGNGECNGRRLSGAPFPARRIGEREECQDGARPALLVSVVEMVDVRSIEVDCLLHEAKAQEADVEVHVRLRVACQRGDVVDPLDIHDVLPDEPVDRRERLGRLHRKPKAGPRGVKIRNGRRGVNVSVNLPGQATCEKTRALLSFPAALPGRKP